MLRLKVGVQVLSASLGSYAKPSPWTEENGKMTSA
ncbi:MAG: hypothetical protein ACI9U2_001796 [Bradymonadia bacterium]|jgi:hypothetical protein